MSRRCQRGQRSWASIVARAKSLDDPVDHGPAMNRNEESTKGHGKIGGKRRWWNTSERALAVSTIPTPTRRPAAARPQNIAPHSLTTDITSEKAGHGSIPSSSSWSGNRPARREPSDFACISLNDPRRSYSPIHTDSRYLFFWHTNTGSISVVSSGYDRCAIAACKLHRSGKSCLHFSSLRGVLFGRTLFERVNIQ